MATDNKLDFRMITQSIEDCIDFGSWDSEHHLDACIVDAFYDDLRYLLFVGHDLRVDIRFELNRISLAIRILHKTPA